MTKKRRPKKTSCALLQVERPYDSLKKICLNIYNHEKLHKTEFKLTATAVL